MIPDGPARAFRDSAGKVRLIATSYENWSLYGSSLDDVKPDCQPLFHGAERSDPAAFDDRGWIEATYTKDGHTVDALISNEWDAFRHKASAMKMAAACRARQGTPGCMAYSINLAISNDSGRDFRYAPAGGQQVVAGTAYQSKAPVRNGNLAADVLPAPRGFPTVSNIIERDGYFYAMVFDRGATAAEDGNCLFRTTDPGDASQWRAWDGHSFTIRPVDTGASNATAQPCPRIARGVLGWDVRSLSWNAKAKSYIAIMLAASVNAAGQRVVGVYYTTSPDLLRWSESRLLLEAPSELDKTCKPPVHYPSMLDPASQSRNFETVGDTAYIYYTQYNVKGCQVSLDRDLRRLPVAIEPAR